MKMELEEKIEMKATFYPMHASPLSMHKSFGFKNESRVKQVTYPN